MFVAFGGFKLTYAVPSSCSGTQLSRFENDNRRWFVARQFRDVVCCGDAGHARTNDGNFAFFRQFFGRAVLIKGVELGSPVWDRGVVNRQYLFLSLAAVAHVHSDVSHVVVGNRRSCRLEKKDSKVNQESSSIHIYLRIDLIRCNRLSSSSKRARLLWDWAVVDHAHGSRKRTPW